MLKVKAGSLAEALKPPKPHQFKRRAKPFIVSLEHEPAAGTLAVIEAEHGIVARAVSVSGDWPGAVQVNGTVLYRLTATWPPDAELQLNADAQSLVVRMAKSIVRIARMDDGGGQPIIRTPLPSDKRHKGKVQSAPDPTSRRVDLDDTWDFSARVPMPQHRSPEKGD